MNGFVNIIIDLVYIATPTSASNPETAAKAGQLHVCVTVGLGLCKRTSFQRKDKHHPDVGKPMAATQVGSRTRICAHAVRPT